MLQAVDGGRLLHHHSVALLVRQRCWSYRHTVNGCGHHLHIKFNITSYMLQLRRKGKALEREKPVPIYLCYVWKTTHVHDGRCVSVGAAGTIRISGSPADASCHHLQRQRVCQPCLPSATVFNVTQVMQLFQRLLWSTANNRTLPCRKLLLHILMDNLQ